MSGLIDARTRHHRSSADHSADAAVGEDDLTVPPAAGTGEEGHGLGDVLRCPRRSRGEPIDLLHRNGSVADFADALIANLVLAITLTTHRAR